jgi:hypothetical protein
LSDGAKLGVQCIDAGVAVVLEKLLKRSPEVCSGGVVVGDEIEELGGDAGVDPLYNCEIVLNPTRICGTRHRGRIDMIAKTTSAEMNVKQVAPMIVVV